MPLIIYYHWHCDSTKPLYSRHFLPPSLSFSLFRSFALSLYLTADACLCVCLSVFVFVSEIVVGRFHRNLRCCKSTDFVFNSFSLRHANMLRYFMRMSERKKIALSSRMTHSHIFTHKKGGRSSSVASTIVRVNKIDPITLFEHKVSYRICVSLFFPAYHFGAHLFTFTISIRMYIYLPSSLLIK